MTKKQNEVVTTTKETDNAEKNQILTAYEQLEKIFQKNKNRFVMPETETETHKFNKYVNKLVSTNMDGTIEFERVKVDSCEIVASGSDYETNCKKEFLATRKATLENIEKLSVGREHLLSEVMSKVSRKLKPRNPYLPIKTE